MTTQIGLVFVRQIRAPHVEPFFNQIMLGLEDGLNGSGSSLLVRRVHDAAEELAVYGEWKRQRVVDAVVVKDMVHDDPRPGLLRDLELPYVMLGDVSLLDGHAAVHTDNAQTMRDGMAHLIGNGHRHIARVTGPADLVHTQIRTKAFLAAAIAADVTSVVLIGDYSKDSGRRLTNELLTSAAPPSAIVYDNDLMAVGGLSAAQALDIAVPDDVSLLAWDDSIACQLTRPPLSALSHDVHEVGVQLSHLLLELLRTGTATVEASAQPVLVERGSSDRSDAARLEDRSDA